MSGILQIPKSKVTTVVPGRLYIGSHDAPLALKHPVNTHVHTAEEVRPFGKGAYEVIWLKLDDLEWDWAECPDEVEQLLTLAAKLARLVQNGKSVLITCHMGLNRSGMLTALVMCALGMPPQDAIKELRRLRSPDVLCNPSFEDMVLHTGTELRKICKVKR